MAKIGLRNFMYAPFVTEDASTHLPKYTADAKGIGKAIDCKVSVETNEATLYADDSLAESDYGFKKGSMDITTDDVNADFIATALGHTVSGESGQEIIKRNADDVAPYISVARIVKKMNSGAVSYKVEYIWKIKFKEPSAEEATKGEGIEFKTTALSGTFATLSSGAWSEARSFASYDLAVADITKTFKKAST